MAKDNRDRTSIDLRGIRDRIEAIHRDVDLLREMKFTQVIRTLLIRGIEAFERQYSPRTSIAYLVRQWSLEELAAETEISLEVLRRIQDGVRPTDGELVDLATALVKSNGEAWNTHELMAIRDATFQKPVSKDSKEKQPNGNRK